MKYFVHLIDWCEIDGEANVTFEKNDNEIIMNRGSDKEIVQQLRDINEESTDDDGTSYYWDLKGIVHTPRTTLVEWMSGRGHHATTQICWLKKA